MARTNADCIRSMNNKELSQWLTYPICKYAGCATKCPVILGNNDMKCEENILEWLQQLAEKNSYKQNTSEGVFDFFNP